jgi:hypothetical protein
MLTCLALSTIGRNIVLSKYSNMIAQILTTAQIRSCEGRDYNPQVWETNIERMLNNYTDVVFYHVPKGDGYDYDRYFVEYTLPEGLRLFGSFSYGGSMTSGGFYRLDKSQVTKDGKTYGDIHKLVTNGKTDDARVLLDELMDSSMYDISYGKFHDQASGEMVMIGTNKEARAWMIQRSVTSGLTFTKG